MCKLSALVFATTLAVVSAFLSSRIATCGVRIENSKLFSNCADKVRDHNGRCPGDAGYRPVIREAPSDFASYMAAQKARGASPSSPAGKSSVSSSPAPAARSSAVSSSSYGSRPAAAAPVASAPKSYGASPSGSAANNDGRCADKVRDGNGRCPGDAGYRPVIREAPSDFASYMAAQKARGASPSSPAGRSSVSSSPAPAARSSAVSSSSYGSRPAAAAAAPVASAPKSYGASPSGSAAKNDGRCLDKVRDHNGRCPGDAGYRPVIREAPSDFASYMAAQKAKK